MTPSLPAQTAPHCASFGPPFDERTSARGSGPPERRTRNTRERGGMSKCAMNRTSVESSSRTVVESSSPNQAAAGNRRIGSFDSSFLFFSSLLLVTLRALHSALHQRYTGRKCFNSMALAGFAKHANCGRSDVTFRSNFRPFPDDSPCFPGRFGVSVRVSKRPCNATCNATCNAVSVTAALLLPVRGGIDVQRHPAVELSSCLPISPHSPVTPSPEMRLAGVPPLAGGPTGGFSSLLFSSLLFWPRISPNFPEFPRCGWRTGCDDKSQITDRAGHNSRRRLAVTAESGKLTRKSPLQATPRRSEGFQSVRGNSGKFLGIHGAPMATSTGGAA